MSEWGRSYSLDDVCLQRAVKFTPLIEFNILIQRMGWEMEEGFEVKVLSQIRPWRKWESESVGKPARIFYHSFYYAPQKTPFIRLQSIHPIIHVHTLLPYSTFPLHILQDFSTQNNVSRHSGTRNTVRTSMDRFQKPGPGTRITSQSQSCSLSNWWAP